MHENLAAQVLTWLAGQNAHQMQTSAITHAKILVGVALLPAGKRSVAMAQATGQILKKIFRADASLLETKP